MEVEPALALVLFLFHYQRMGFGEGIRRTPVICQETSTPGLSVLIAHRWLATLPLTIARANWPISVR
jgi:hypothetical protein